RCHPAAATKEACTRCCATGRSGSSPRTSICCCGAASVPVTEGGCWESSEFSMFPRGYGLCLRATARHPDCFLNLGERLMVSLIPHRPGPAATGLTAQLASSGCGGGYAPEARRVDAGQARRTLESVLTSWQLGDTPQSWREHDPQVAIQDTDWSAGR